MSFLRMAQLTPRPHQDVQEDSYLCTYFKMKWQNINGQGSGIGNSQYIKPILFDQFFWQYLSNFLIYLISFLMRVIALRQNTTSVRTIVYPVKAAYCRENFGALPPNTLSGLFGDPAQLQEPLSQSPGSPGVNVCVRHRPALQARGSPSHCIFGKIRKMLAAASGQSAG